MPINFTMNYRTGPLVQTLHNSIIIFAVHAGVPLYDGRVLTLVLSI